MRNPWTATSGGYAFRHALLAEVANGDLLHGERDRLHAAFGGELERRGEVGGLPVTPAELAYHWVAARDGARALPALVAAGTAAEQVYALRGGPPATTNVPSSCGSATEPPTDGPMNRVGVMQRAAECAVLTGDYARAVELGRSRDRRGRGPRPEPPRHAPRAPSLVPVGGR